MAKFKDAGILLLISMAALLVHGYHPWAEDAEIYLPGIEKKLDPSLFPINSQFFESHANATRFPNLIAASIRITHLPLNTALFCWHVLSIFGFLLALWYLIGQCFSDRTARWAGVCLVAALFTLPVAGTALYIFDQYLNPRNLTSALGVLCLAIVLQKRYVLAVLLLVVIASLHPLMMVFVFTCAVLIVLFDRFTVVKPLLASLLPFGLTFDPPPPAYHQVAVSHRYHYLLRWEWYEWLGALAPIAILWWFGKVARQRGMRNLDLICRALIVLLSGSIVGALVLSIPQRFESLARIQPLRSLHLVYILMFLFAGAFLGQHVLKKHVWRWAVLFVPLCAGMFLAQRSLFPASAHVEWPWKAPSNPWAQAFQWVRQNTPKDALFALDPYHMTVEGEDQNGFRAIAQRSMLADAVKDSGAVTMFPPLADVWLQQFQAQKNWKQFNVEDFKRLQAAYGVSWVILQQPAVSGLSCPFQNEAVRVCQLL